ncbi:hypothetical protein GC176_27555 [bacterium]|nr:hypothetical protein [bacterium]
MNHPKKTQPRNTQSTATGAGQLTLAEHSLCPLHAERSLQPNLVHHSEFFYMDADRHLRRGRAQVTCPLGLLAGDELYLWGLLGLTLAQPDSDGQLYATPHYCLRQLGLIDQKSRRGGRQYRQFTDAIQRLSTVTYQNDAFYDPIRREHRRVSLRFFSYSLPLEPQSSRVWRFAWDPLFFELIQPAGGFLLFELDVYRQLDPASRRLFLLLSKLFWRRSSTPRFELRHLAVDVLGFAPELADRDLRKKLLRCIRRLKQIDVVASAEDLFSTSRSGLSRLHLQRGSYFQRRRRRTVRLAVQESALFEPLTSLGFELRSVRWLVKSFPVSVLREWADIALAAREHKGERFFRKSLQAWFVDNVRHAAAGTRTPPDWWHELQTQEQNSHRCSNSRRPERAIDPTVLVQSPDTLHEIVKDHLAAARRC